MAGRFAPRYHATNVDIVPGDCVTILIDSQPVFGVVRTASVTSRRIEVWVSRRAVANHQARRRSCSRKDVMPVPGTDRRTWLPMGAAQVSL